jgi:hypothetical protein
MVIMTFDARYFLDRIAARRIPARTRRKPATAKFFNTDAGRSIHFFGERRDCTVRALAIAKAISYSEAHAALAKHADRKPGGGAYFSHVALPAGLVPLSVPTCPEATVAVTLRNLPRSGRFIVATAGHVFAYTDGYVCDTFSPKLRSRVKAVYKA